jgi:hypothetical protein
MLSPYLQEVYDRFLWHVQDKTFFPVDVAGSELTLSLFSGDMAHVLGFFWRRFWYSGVGCNVPVYAVFSQCWLNVFVPGGHASVLRLSHILHSWSFWQCRYGCTHRKCLKINCTEIFKCLVYFGNLMCTCWPRGKKQGYQRCRRVWHHKSSLLFTTAYHISVCGCFIKLLPSSWTAMDIYCFMHYVKLVMIAQQPHQSGSGENWEKSILCRGWHSSHLTLSLYQQGCTYGNIVILLSCCQYFRDDDFFFWSWLQLPIFQYALAPPLCAFSLW